ALLLSCGLFAQETPAAPKKKPDEVGKFKMDTIEMNKVKQDNPTTAVFEVTNIGSEPLIIEQANPTCGCTIGDFTKEPINPGKTGFIKATYNAKNLGVFVKTLRVKFAGNYDEKFIVIKGEVVKADDPAAPAENTIELKTEKTAPPAKEKKVSKKAKTKPSK
ncbi:MAG: DUF1573 domain-containing protein, partial [Ferruginibacter sp.]|nr:DUF1573 domain-containing protein [Ferruginibacter sp.]